MVDEIHLWRIGADDELTEISSASLDLESRLQEWLARDISIVDPALLVIGREVETDFGGFIDILCANEAGELVIVELKRDRTPREVTAQALDYASWVAGLSNERVTSIADANLGAGFEAAFTEKFGSDLPETLNGHHQAPSSELGCDPRAAAEPFGEWVGSPISRSGQSLRSGSLGARL